MTAIRRCSRRTTMREAENMLVIRIGSIMSGEKTIDNNKSFTYAQRFDVNIDDFIFTTIRRQEGRSTTSG